MFGHMILAMFILLFTLLWSCSYFWPRDFGHVHIAGHIIDHAHIFGHVYIAGHIIHHAHILDYVVLLSRVIWQSLAASLAFNFLLFLFPSLSYFFWFFFSWERRVRVEEQESL